jgi:hypothetical protein
MIQKRHSIYPKHCFIRVISKPLILVLLALVVIMITPLASLAQDTQHFNIDIPSYIKVREGFGIDRVVQSLAILFLVSSFLERTLEIFILDFHKEYIGDNEKDKKQNKEEKKRFTSLFTLTVGLLISGIGIRGIEPFLILNNDPQGYFFRMVDIFLTGTVISGGTAAIHKILTSLTAFMDATKESNEVSKAKAIEAKEIEAKDLIIPTP